MKNKELGKEALLKKLRYFTQHFARYITHDEHSGLNENGRAIEQIEKLFEQSGEKPEITDALLDDIIDILIEHATCHHDVSRDEDGIHYSSEYSIDDEKKVKEKLNKILKGGD